MIGLFNINNITSTLCFAVIFHVLLFIFLYLVWEKYFRIQPDLSCLLVIAHPDDETMFFAPTIIKLINSGVSVFVLCITTGNSGGLGMIRKYELGKAVQCLGMNSGNVTILDITEFPDGFVKWNETERLAKIILRTAEALNCNWIITFDEHGISSHPNHISCFIAVNFLLSKGFLPRNMQVSYNL